MAIIDIESVSVLREFGAHSVYSFISEFRDPAIETYFIEAFDKTLDEIDELIDNGMQDGEIIEQILDVIPNRYFRVDFIDHGEGYFKIIEFDLAQIEKAIFKQFPKEYFSQEFIKNIIAKKI